MSDETKGLKNIAKIFSMTGNEYERFKKNVKDSGLGTKEYVLKTASKWALTKVATDI